MDSMRRRFARRGRRGDGALIGMTDAFLTLLILGIAAFILWRGSLAPTGVQDDVAAQVESAQVSALTGSLLRVTLEKTHIWTGTGAGDYHEMQHKSVATLLGEMHRHVFIPNCEAAACPQPGGQNRCPGEGGARACDVVDLGRAIMAESIALGSDRWTLSLNLRDDQGRELCIHKADDGPDAGTVTVTKVACDPPRTVEVIAREAFVPVYGSASGALHVHVLAYKELGQ